MDNQFWVKPKETKCKCQREVQVYWVRYSLQALIPITAKQNAPGEHDRREGEVALQRGGYQVFQKLPCFVTLKTESSLVKKST